jgi:hypothetical protein
MRGGFVYETDQGSAYVTGGLGIVTPRIGVDLAGRFQVVNGSEVMLQLSLRLFLPN